MRTELFDVVILGGGAAGLSAALAAAEVGAAGLEASGGGVAGSGSQLRVAVVSKVYPMRSHTVAAEGGAAGVHRDSDTFELHEADTLRAGAGLAEPAAVKYVVEQAPVELARLEHLGMPFSRTDDGDVETRRFGGMSQPRTWFAADKTGFHLLHTVYQSCLQYPNIEFFNEYFAFDLKLPNPQVADCRVKEPVGGRELNPDDLPNSPAAIPNPSPCAQSQGPVGQIGLLTYSQGDGEPVLFLSPTLIIATGGYARAWGTSTNAAIVTGDGQALALRAGIPLRDMEFVQWHPTCLPGSGILITEAARGEGGVLLDKNGERYLADYGLGPVTAIGHPEPRQMELGPRDALSQAFIAAKADGRTRKLPGTDLDVVDLDLTHLGAGALKEKLPLILELAKRYARVDATKQPIPICPAAHYTMGGIPTNTDGQVIGSIQFRQLVPGLYAAGECASTGLHGANRLGSNSLVETLVMGRTAGAHAAAAASNAKNQLAGAENRKPHRNLLHWAQRTWDKERDKWGESAENKKRTENHHQLQAELGASLDQNYGIRLTPEGIEQLGNDLQSLITRYKNVKIAYINAKYNTDWQQAMELGFMLDCALVTYQAAKQRRESRGAFQRTDYPETDPVAQHISITRDTYIGKDDSEWDYGFLKTAVGDSEVE